MGLFQVITIVPGAYHIALPSSMATVHSWFHTNLFKPTGLQPAGPPVLEDNSYKVETILQINKRGKHAKVK